MRMDGRTNRRIDRRKRGRWVRRYMGSYLLDTLRASHTHHIIMLVFGFVCCQSVCSGALFPSQSTVFVYRNPSLSVAMCAACGTFPPHLDVRRDFCVRPSRVFFNDGYALNEFKDA